MAALNFTIKKLLFVDARVLNLFFFGKSKKKKN